MEFWIFWKKDVVAISFVKFELTQIVEHKSKLQNKNSKSKIEIAYVNLNF